MGWIKRGAAAPRTLFISHDDFRAGAPIVLLRLLSWLKSETSVECEVLLRDCYNDLRPEFESLARVSTWQVDGLGEAAMTAHRDALLRRWGRSEFDLIYSNTITNGAVLEALSVLGIPVITHVHELGFWIRHRLGPLGVEQVTRRTNRYIAASEAVRANLIQDVGVPESCVDVVYQFVPSVFPHVSDGERSALRKRLGIPHDAFVIGGCGTMDWRKGPDLFVQIAATVARRSLAGIHFVWLGGNLHGLEMAQLRHDVQRAGVGAMIHFVGTVEKPWAYLALFDVLALTSREDPFPLANLEAASLGVPIVCFAQSGGSPEFVEPDCGYVVPYLDLEAMTARLLELHADPDLRLAMGRLAQERVRERHVVSVAGPRILDIMNHVAVNVRGR